MYMASYDWRLSFQNTESHGSRSVRLGDLWFQALQHVMRVFRIISLLPKGGETVWGDLNRSPEEENMCHSAETQFLHSSSKENNVNYTDTRRSIQVKKLAKYGRLVSFGKVAFEIPSSQLSLIDPKEIVYESAPISSTSCEELLTEYDGLSRESIKRVTENKAYTTRTLIDLLSLPDAPDMEILCSYGVGIPTERSYVYKMSPSDRCKTVPLQIDIYADRSDRGCLSGEVYFVDGDESLPVLSAGFMCAREWRGKTGFNSSSIDTYIREYRHKPPASFLEGRGTESGAHVDILGNFALIEEVLRVVVGASGTDLGGDRIYSGIMAI